LFEKITGENVGRMQVVQWLNENHPGLLPFLKLRFSAWRQGAEAF
jgi:hypothetical protein